jgi:hypothetical protein
MNTAALLRQYHSKVTKQADGTLILPVGRFIIDIFTGDGWDKHSRYRKLKGKLIHVSGIKLSHEDLVRATSS